MLSRKRWVPRAALTTQAKAPAFENHGDHDRPLTQLASRSHPLKDLSKCGREPHSPSSFRMGT
jgi:hypothetical protein